MSATRKPLSSRHEAFCRHLADGCSQAEAARRAGYPPASARQRGSELYARTEIQARAGELMAQRADEREAMKGQMLAGLKLIHDKAMDTDRLSLALRALLAMARISGLNGAAPRQPKAPVHLDLEPDPEPDPEPAPPRPGARAPGRKVRPAAAPDLPPQLAAALDTLLARPSPPPPRPGPLADMPLPALRFA